MFVCSCSLLSYPTKLKQEKYLTLLGQEKKLSWFWSSGGSILMQIKKKCRPQNKYDTEKNTESSIFFTCQSSESTFICILSCYMNVLSLPFRLDTHINTGLIWISSFKIWNIYVVVQKNKKGPPGHRTNFQKSSFFPGLTHKLSILAILSK